MKKDNLIITYIKGFLMGICEVIPGISGSTMALFLNIYEKLIISLSNFMPQNLLKIFKKKKLNLIKDLEISFLFFLLIGMISAILLFSHIIGFLINNYRSYIFSVFVGFVIISTFINGRHHINLEKIIYPILGLLSGLSLLFLSQNNIFGFSNLEIMLIGIITIIFGLLPGVSGSFMLLIIGKYDYIISSVRNLEIVTLLYFLIGLIIGTILFISIIKNILKKNRENLLSFFFAFVLGSVSILLIEIINNLFEFSFLLVLFYILIGGLLGFVLNKLIS